MSDLSPEGRTLFQRAKRDLSPTSGDRERVGRALTLEIGALAATTKAAATAAETTLAAGTGTATATKTVTLFGAIKWLAPLVIVLGAGAAFVKWRPAPVANLAPTVTSAAEMQLPPAPPPTPTPAKQEVEAPATTSKASEPVVRAAPARTVSTASVAEEARLLKEADEAIRNGDPKKALALLERHRRMHPKGALVEERTAERVLALCRAGREHEGKREAARFLSAHPKSPLANSVREACAKAK